MKMFLTFIFSILSFFLYGQETKKLGLTLPKDERSVTIPFKIVNNLIIIPVTVNGIITLDFILDSGASTPILTERIFGDIVGLEYDRSIEISGPGVVDSVMAYVANNVNLSLPEGIEGQNMSMLVLEEDYINLKKNLGEEIYGIIGYDVFSRFIVTIDYHSMELTLTEPSFFKTPKKFKKLNMKLEGTKPYIQTIVNQNGRQDSLKMMVDTGASHSLLLDIHVSDVFTLPDSTISTTLGHGLGGEIPGEIGRFSKIRLDNYELDNILVSIPNQGAYSNVIKRGSRNGTIGSNTLSHFHVIMDYYNELMYIKKGPRFNEPFEYDMSGMRLSFFENPERLEITHILNGSPADKAGLEEGMIVKSVNYRNLKNSSLSNIYSLLRKKPNLKIRVKVFNEEGKIDKYKFRLKRLI